MANNNTGLDSLPAVEELPPLGELPTISGTRMCDVVGSQPITDSDIVDEYINRRLQELHTTPNNDTAVQKIVFEIIHKGRLTTAVFQKLRGTSELWIPREC